MEIQIDNDYLKLSDIDVVASILASGKVKLVGIDGSNDKRLFFLLSPKSICLELTNSYYNNTLTVSAREMSNRVRELKDLLFNEKRKNIHGREGDLKWETGTQEQGK